MTKRGGLPDACESARKPTLMRGYGFHHGPDENRRDQTLQRSARLQDFRRFAVRFFSENILDKAYLDQIKKINEDFRRKAANPYMLDAQAAPCRDLLRTCLNELILNYKGSEDSNISEPE